MDPGVMGGGGDAELRLFPFVLVIITVTLCQYSKHKFHFGKEFH